MFQRKVDVSTRKLVLAQESSYKREIVFVGISVLWVYTLLAVLSYNPFDATLFYYSSAGAAVTNWAGSLGASIAALFFYLFGIATYVLISIILFLLGSFVFKMSGRQIVGRIFLGVGLMFVCAPLATSYEGFFFQSPAGGLLGAYSNYWLGVVVGPVGSQLLLWGTLWILISLFARVPLVALMMAAVRYMLSMLKRLWITIKRKLVRAKKPQQPSNVLVRAAASAEVDEFDVALLEELEQGEAKDAKRIEPRLSPEQIARRAAYAIRRVTEHTRVLSVPFVKIPNTVLAINLFAVPHGMQKSPYELIYALASDVYQLPDCSLFDQPPEVHSAQESSESLEARARKVEEKLQHFGVKGSVVAIKPGPVVTMFEYKPDIDSKISKILSLEDDLAMALTAQSLRILAPIPGRNVVGFEIANAERQSVFISQIFSSPTFESTQAALPIVLGVDSEGNSVVADLATMPHLLVGGATGSGKSVELNSMLVSLLCKRTPDELKLILIDPKRLEFTPYSDIPHLLFPIVTQPSRAAAALAWVVQEMEARYEAMASAGVRHVTEYQKLVRDAHAGRSDGSANGDGVALRSMPYIVLIIDELADLMMVAGKEVETHIVRIAQMARAAGIHLIVATQRPSVDVVTGLIKVNFPSRVAFRVSSKVDSRTILDSQGAEHLLGRGDLLFMHASSPELKRMHGAYVSDQEVERVADFLRAQRQPQYLDLNEAMLRNAAMPKDDIEDELYVQVRDSVQTMDEISISMLQRMYRIGFNRSARLIERLEHDGLIAPAQGSKPRKVLR